MTLSPAMVDDIIQAQADAWYEGDTPRLHALDAALQEWGEAATA